MNSDFACGFFIGRGRRGAVRGTGGPEAILPPVRIGQVPGHTVVLLVSKGDADWQRQPLIMWAVAFTQTQSSFSVCPAGCQRAAAPRVSVQDAQTRGACGGALRPARARLVRDPAGRAEPSVLSEK